MKSIKRVEVRNFKSFKKLEVDLRPFNVLIGANASGKSNFIQIFKFLRDIINLGLENAVSMQGGIEYLRNMNIGAREDLTIKVVYDTDFTFPEEEENQDLKIKIYEVIHEFALKFNGTEFEVGKDNLTLKCKFVELEKQEGKEGEKTIKNVVFFLSRVDGNINISIKPEESQIKEDDIYRLLFREEKLTIAFFGLVLLSFSLPRDIAIYDFDPKLPKKATPITGKIELEEDGSNLSIVLNNIIKDEEKKRKLYNLISDLLPFVDDLGVEKFADRSLLFKLRERYLKDQYLPASLISDGTINITAMIIALYFEEKDIIIIEEPERNIHPYLISKVVDMMKDASKNKQIIVTTHNPEIVKYAGLENLLLVSRDKDGFSIISRTEDKKEIKMFLEKEIGIEELYIQNLLEG